MGSAAVDCRPLRDTNSGTAALANIQVADGISSPTAAGAAGQRTPGSAKKAAIAVHGHLFGEEAVGRQLAIVQPPNSAKGWAKATVLEYDAELGQHKIKHHSSKHEEWLYLSDLKFKWSHVLPPNAPANPTYRAEYSREAAVGKRLRVYWPAMQKWYHGMVKAYDPKTDRHTISYKDGDLQSLLLKHEPILWSDDDLAANGYDQPTATTPRSIATSPRAVTSPRAFQGASGTFVRAQPAAAGTATATPAAVPPPAATTATAPPAAPPPATAGRPLAAVRRKTLTAPPAAAEAAPTPVMAVTAPKAPTRTGRPVGRPPKVKLTAGAGANVPRGKSPGPSGPAATAAARNALASSFAATVFGRARSASATSGQAAMGTGVYRPPLNGTIPGSRPLAAGSAAASMASRQQILQRSTLLGKHGRDSSGLAADSASKRFKRGGMVRTGLPGAAGRSVTIADKHLAVGSRVGVYWRLDKMFYRGKITSYSPQSGKYTVKYDDGQSEQVMLERERFIWHSPRGMSAGYRPALHALMQQLGSEGLQTEPQIGVDGMVIPEVKGPEGAPHPPISGAGAVGWRIQLYWGGDQAWHEAEVLSFDEARRRHHVLYLDGEEEWLDLSRDNLVWVKATRHGAISAGVVTGDDVPKGRDAFGWHIAVYWKDDKTFYEGEIIDFENSAGRHKVLYNDGEEEWLHLRNERVIWRLPPSEDSSDEGSEELDDEYDLQGSDDEVIDGERVSPSRGRGRGRFKPRRKMRRLNDIDGPLRARSRGLDSDSASASSGHGQPHFALAGGPADDGLGSDGVNHMQQQYAVPVAAYSQNGLQQSGAYGPYGDPNSNVQPKRSLGPSVSFKGGRGPGALGSAYNNKTLGGVLARQGSMGGRGGSGAAGGISGHPSLPPLQLRRSSGSGDVLGSPLCRPAATADQIQLVVRIVPGGLDKAAAAATGARVDGAAAADAVALQPLLQGLPVREQRAAVRLQKKMDRLQMILGKLATTASTMGWKLDPQVLPSPALLSPRAAAAAASQQQMVGLGPMSPRARAGLKGGLKGPTSPTAANAPMSPRASAAVRQTNAATIGAVAANLAAATAAATTAAVTTSPTAACAAAAASAAALSPSSKIVPVVAHKSCAVNSTAVQVLSGGGALAAVNTRPISDTADHSAASSAVANLVSADASAQAVLQLQQQQDKPALIVSGVPQLKQPAQAAHAVPGTAGTSAAVTVSTPVSFGGSFAIAVPAAMLTSPAVMHLQQRLQEPAGLAAIAAAAAAAGHCTVATPAADIKQQQAAAAAQAVLAGFPTKAQVLTTSTAAAVQQAVQATANGASKPTSPVAATGTSPPQAEPKAAAAAAMPAAPGVSPTKAAASTANAVGAALVKHPAGATGGLSTSPTKAALATSPTRLATAAVAVSPAKTATAAGNASTGAAGPTKAATPTSAAPARGRALAPLFSGGGDPSAPSVQRSADDVVQLLQAMAAAQGNSSPAVQQQLQHMAAAVAAANSVVKSPVGSNSSSQ